MTAHLQGIADRDSVLPSDVENRCVWEDFVARTVAGAVYTEPLFQLARFYLSMEDTTGTVERNLGIAATILSRHTGPLSEDGSTLSALLEYRLDGPQKEEELFRRSGVAFLPSDFMRDVALMWLRVHGRRFRSYTPQDKTKRRRPTPKTGTLSALRSGRIRAGKRLLEEGAAERPERQSSLLSGLTRQDLLPDAYAIVSRASRATEQYESTTEVKRARYLSGISWG